MKKPRKNFLSTHDVAREFMRQGEQILYMRQGLYPVLELHVTVLERSREQLGDLEKTVLSLVQAGLCGVASLASAIGIAEGRLVGFLREIVGRGLLAELSGSLALTALGQMSIENGAEVVRVRRSILLCALSGRLLPRSFYSEERIGVEQLSQKVWRNVLLSPENRTSLNALNLAAIEDRHAVNIPDTALSIQSLDEVRPWFLGMIMVLVGEPGAQPRGFAVNGREQLAINEVSLLTSWLEPLGYSAKLSSSQMLAKIEQELAETGCKARCELDQLGNPRALLLKVLPDFEKIQLAGVPLMRHVGSSMRAPVPVARFPFAGKEDWLYGRTLSFINEDEALVSALERYHVVSGALESFFNQPDNFMQGSFVDFFK